MLRRLPNALSNIVAAREGGALWVICMDCVDFTHGDVDGLEEHGLEPDDEAALAAGSRASYTIGVCHLLDAPEGGTLSTCWAAHLFRVGLSHSVESGNALGRFAGLPRRMDIDGTCSGLRRCLRRGQAHTHHAIATFLSPHSLYLISFKVHHRPTVDK